MDNQKVLRDILKRGANNFDILRLIAALAVIVGHSYAIAPQPPYQDGVLRILHFDYSGSLAVKFFFFLSGLLVTNSIVTKPDAFRFLAKRAFRIFPGLFVCLLISVLIVGPLFTKLSLGAYFSNSETWHYLFNNTVLINMRWRLPEVFAESKFGLNGSLWTLPYEVLCYIYLAVFYGLGLLKNKTVANVVFVSVIGISLFAPTHLPAYFSQNPDSYLLPACFALGALFANNKEHIKINLSHVILLWLLVWAFKDSIGFQFLFYIALFYSALYISSTDFVIKHLKLPFDASYGVYVYGFMIQQCLHALFPGMGVHGNQLLSGGIAVAMGIFSWYVVEKRFLELGNRLFSEEKPWSVMKKGMNLSWGRGEANYQSFKGLLQNRVFVFTFFVILALIIHAAVLKFIFPGYYSPLYPQHSDFYIPATLANSSHPNYSFIGLLGWPRPMHMTFMKIIGYTGIHGSIACVIALVAVNCVLAALLIKRIFNLSFNWKLVAGFSIYCFLVFSQPYFYIFYAQDIGTHLSFFFLLWGAHLFYTTFNRSTMLANLLLFSCGLLAFLSKETYGLVGLFLALLWVIYYRRVSLLKAILPLLVIGIAFIIAFIINVVVKSAFVNPDASAESPYHISLQPFVVLRQWLLYARESLNIANISIISLLLAFLIFSYQKVAKKELLYIVIGCMIAAGLAWVPNAVLPNHHYKGYSFNGAYLFFLPLLLLPILWVEFNRKKVAVVLGLSLCFLSPLLDIPKYKDESNTWVLYQEKTQRNLLNGLEASIKTLTPSKTPQKVLIEGITFPFQPFVFPEALRVYPNAVFANFDVVNHNPSIQNGDRADLVKFVKPEDSGLVEYDQKWIFNEEGQLVSTQNLAAEKVFDKAGDSAHLIRINYNDLPQFSATGFYGPENGINWTNGNVSIDLKNAVQNKDSIILRLNTYMPPICKNVMPRLKLTDRDNNSYDASLSTRKGDMFYYLFVVNKKNIQKINILSETVNAAPDLRTLSFPFVSLEINQL